MMTYLSAYNAASRLMTALDEALNTLISGTGLVEDKQNLMMEV